jgi:hypothetical protein
LPDVAIRRDDLSPHPRLAQFQERCGQIALKMFWEQTHPAKRAEAQAARPSRNGKHELLTNGVN